MSKQRRRRRAQERASHEQFDPELAERAWDGRKQHHADGRAERDRRRGRPADSAVVHGDSVAVPIPAQRRRARDDDDSLTSHAERAWDALLAPAGAALTCGGCCNWRPHSEPGGRGTCDHPASGFSYPYEDTAACPFFEARRR